VFFCNNRLVAEKLPKQREKKIQMSQITELTTEQLEMRDAKNTRTIRALTSWSNRNLSKKVRAQLIADLRIEQDQILVELMKRETVNN